MSRYIIDYSSEAELTYFKLMNSLSGNWCLSGSCLVHYVRNMSLNGVKNITTKQHPKVIEVMPADNERVGMNIPSPIGKELDSISDKWSEYPQFNRVHGGRKGVRYIPRSVNGIYMTDKRKANAHELVAGMLKCGEKVGIKDRMFIGFGGALGYAMINDFLWNDDDVDMCILSDGLKQETMREYLMELKRSGFCEKRLHGPRLLNGRYVWFSIGNRSRKGGSGTKSCNWFWFKHGGFYWHSKGVGWRDFAAKGIPLSVFNGDLKTVKMGPNEVQVPKKLGACLDWWYGDWVDEKGGSSKETALLYINNEKDRSSWKIRIK